MESSSGKKMMSVASEIRTPRLRLRPPQIADAPAVFKAYGSDPEVARFMPWQAHRTVAESQAYLQTRITWCAEGTHCYWLITKAESQQVLGMIGLQIEGHAAEVGFVLSQAVWGHGYTTEALKPVLDIALAIPGVYRVWGYCDVENGASARVMEKAGMTREGLHRRYARFSISDEPRDVYIFARVR